MSRPPSSRPARGPEGAAAPGSEAEGAEQPGQINALTIVPVEVMDLCVPKTSSRSCDQAIFVNQATEASLFSDAVLVEIDRVG